MDELKWQRINFALRIIIIGILLVIAVSIIYFKFGYPGNLEDSKLRNELGTVEIDCREALVYYAVHELGTIDQKKADEIYKEYNLGKIEFSK